MSGSRDNKWRGGASRPTSQTSQRNAERDKRRRQGYRRDDNAGGASKPPQEEHVPVRGFNRVEVMDFLKRPKAKSCTPYKPTSKDGQNQRSTPSGPKAHFMANGKDFFLELRKQIAALQRGGPPVGG